FIELNNSFIERNNPFIELNNLFTDVNYSSVITDVLFAHERDPPDVDGIVLYIPCQGNPVRKTQNPPVPLHTLRRIDYMYNI
ncbi:MAG: hypothetical protein LBK22_01175, partial [Tannerella sp.]|nr:hypothetical protein [Tannerella sp.]